MKGIGKRKIKKIYKAHDNGLSISQAAKYADVGQTTVGTYWKNAGLKPHYKVGGLSISQDLLEKVRDAYARDMSAAVAEIYIGNIGDDTIKKYWTKMGLPDGPKKITLFHLVSEHKKGVEIEDIAQQYDLPIPVVMDCLEAGYKIILPEARIPESLISKIKNSIIAGESVKEISKKTGVSERNISHTFPIATTAPDMRAVVLEDLIRKDLF